MDATAARQSRRRLAALAVAAALVAWFLAATPRLHAASPGTNPFTSAVTRFIFDNGTVESIQSREGLPGSYKPDVVFYQFCLPPGDSETNTVASGTFVVAPDGKLTGTCKATRSVTSPDGTVDSIAKEGTLSGTYDLAAQTVKFHFESTSQRTYVPPPSCQRCESSTSVAGIVVEGPVSGGEVIGDTAEGTARHTYTCAPANVCFVSRQVATAKFLIQFLPALATAAPGAAGGGTGGGGPADAGLEGLIPLLLLLILVLFATILLVRRVLRTPSLAPAHAAKVLQAGADAAEAIAVGLGPEDIPGSSPAGASSQDSVMKEGVDTAAGILGAGEGSDSPTPSAAAAPAASPSAPAAPAEAASSAGQPAKVPPAASAPDKPSPAPRPPRPGSDEPKLPKRADLEMTENIILGAELIDPEKPPVNPADL